LKYFHGKFDAYRFLYYALRPKLSEFRSISTGAATKFLTLTILNDTEIQVPPLLVQRQIAGILSAYDELMANSQRRVQVLEAMARTLYREWFVYFRFPGHEKVSWVWQRDRNARARGRFQRAVTRETKSRHAFKA
jgi:type I restriction enzyme S subunit